jgi:hypothetical protein
MKATVGRIVVVGDAEDRGIVIAFAVVVPPGTAAETAKALEGCKDFLGNGVTVVLEEIRRAGELLLQRDARAAALVPTSDGRPTLGALVRYALSDLATVAHRDLLAGVVTVADTPQEWRGIAEDFAAASCSPHEHPGNVGDLSCASRAALAMADGDEQRAAAQLAVMAGLDLCSWAEAVEEEMREDSAGAAS